MIFYTPMGPPNFQGFESPAISSRLQRYENVVAECVAEEKLSRVIILTRAAACIYSRYPESVLKIRSRLRGLRGVALFLGYMSADHVRAGYEYVLLPGKVAFNCIPKLIDEEKEYPMLCHAALFSHYEPLFKRKAPG